MTDWEEDIFFFTYTGKESLFISVSPVVDTALKFRGQLDFRLRMVMSICGNKKKEKGTDMAKNKVEMMFN